MVAGGTNLVTQRGHDMTAISHDPESSSHTTVTLSTKGSTTGWEHSQRNDITTQDLAYLHDTTQAHT